MPRIERPFRALVAAVLFLALCAWLGAALQRRLRPAGRTAVVRRVTLTESLPLRGVALREEEAVAAPGGTQLLAEPGRRLPAGAALGRTRRGELLTADRPALFLPDTDGWERLSPALLDTLDAEALAALLDGSPEPTGPVLGRLVYGRAWYFAALCEEPAALSPGPCRVLFAGQTESVPARLLSAEDGLIVLRLTAQGELLSLRRCAAELILGQTEGLAFPEEALRSGPDGPEVTVLTAEGPERCPLTVLGRRDGAVIAACSDGGGALREGSAVYITTEKEGYP